MHPRESHKLSPDAPVKSMIIYPSILLRSTNLTIFLSAHSSCWQFSSLMQLQDDLYELSVHIQSLRRSVRQLEMQIPRTIALGCVTLVDATGYEHQISVNYCGSFEVYSAISEFMETYSLISFSNSR